MLPPVGNDPMPWGDVDADDLTPEQEREVSEWMERHSPAYAAARQWARRLARRSRRRSTRLSLAANRIVGDWIAAARRAALHPLDVVDLEPSHLRRVDVADDDLPPAEAPITSSIPRHAPPARALPDPIIEGRSAA